MPSRIAQAFNAAADRGRAVFVPYITAGDPSLAWTAEIVRRLAAAGAGVIELGIPFSDPVADGPVNQRSAERAIAAGSTLEGAIGLVGDLRRNGLTTPIVLFSYFNPILAIGIDRFAGSAADAGVDGVLIVDLPPEEATDLLPAMRAAAVDTIFLASPTTSPQRLDAIAAASTGFLYYVSRLGVTGERRDLPMELNEEVARVRGIAGKPVAVGFGISTPEQAAEAARFADGVVVGSALVRHLDDPDTDRAVVAIASLASRMASAMSRSASRPNEAVGPASGGTGVPPVN